MQDKIGCGERKKGNEKYDKLRNEPEGQYSFCLKPYEIGTFKQVLYWLGVSFCIALMQRTPYNL